MREQTLVNPLDRFVVILSAIVLSALGAMFYNILPLFLGTAQDFRGLSDSAAGILSSSFYLGFTLTAMTAFFWIRKFSWRAITLLAVPVAIAAMVFAGFAGSYLLMLFGVFVAGGAFSVLYGIGTTMLSDTSHPARWYGLKIAAEAGIGVVLLAVLPGAVIAKWGFEGFMVALAVTVLLVSPMLVGLPVHGIKGIGGAGPHRNEAMVPGLRIALWLGLCGVLCYLFSTTMVWAFVERMANEAGLGAAATGNVLSLSLVFAIGGSLLAVVLADRFGSGKPIVASGLLMLGAIYLFARMDSLLSFGVAACTFTLTFGLGIPYMVTVVADLDLDGRYVVLTVPAIGIGVSLAPAIGGMLTGMGGYTSILLAGGAGVLISVTLAVLALRSGLPHVKAASRVDAG